MKFVAWLLCGVVFLCYSVASQSISVVNQGSQIIATTPSVQIIITGNQNVPKFSVENLNGTAGYKVQFQQAYQTDSTNRAIPSTTISLPSLAWDFSSFAVENGTKVDGKTSDVVRFNITSSSSKSSSTQFQFRVAINAVTQYFKFDTLIQNVDWATDAANFVLCYKLLVDQKTQEKDVTETSPFLFVGDEYKLVFGGGGFVSVKSFAQSGTKRTSVTTSSQGSGGSSQLCINYAKWDVDPLIHDPTIGFDSTTTSWLWLLIPIGIAVGGVAIILVAAGTIGAIAVYVIMRKGKPQYSSF